MRSDNIPRARPMNTSNKDCPMGLYTHYTLHAIVIHTTRHYHVIIQYTYPPTIFVLLTANASAYSHACPLLGNTFSPDHQPIDLLSLLVSWEHLKEPSNWYCHWWSAKYWASPGADLWSQGTVVWSCLVSPASLWAAPQGGTTVHIHPQAPVAEGEGHPSSACSLEDQE